MAVTDMYQVLGVFKVSSKMDIDCNIPIRSSLGPNVSFTLLGNREAWMGHTQNVERILRI
jgi:hypothetical protein